MHKLARALLTVTFVAAALPAHAQDWHGHGDFHDHYDHVANFDHWRAGNWFNGFHDGRNGWWWIVDGDWYFYPAPVYPYPDPYTPPTVVVEQAAPVGAAPAYVYYCSNPAGYYPAIPECGAPWQKVSAGVAPGAVPPPAQAAVPLSAPTNQHDADYEKLNSYADEFAHISITDPHARAKMKDLEKRVEAFHKTLFSRDYNAMDTLRNTEDLEHRIAVQREKLPAPAVIPTPPQ